VVLVFPSLFWHRDTKKENRLSLPSSRFLPEISWFVYLDFYRSEGTPSCLRDYIPSSSSPSTFTKKKKEMMVFLAFLLFLSGSLVRRKGTFFDRFVPRPRRLDLHKFFCVTPHPACFFYSSLFTLTPQTPFLAGYGPSRQATTRLFLPYSCSQAEGSSPTSDPPTVTFPIF